MTRVRVLVYDTDELAKLPVGTVVRAHRDLSVPAGVDIVVRQPNGWFGAWGWEMPIEPGLVVPCTVITIESVCGGPHPAEPVSDQREGEERPRWKPQADPTRYDRRAT